MSEENKTVELNEDELDKVVGGEKIITSFHCPYCDSLLYEDNNDGYIYCLHPNCGYKTRNS